MSDGMIGLATAALEALSRVAKEIPAIKRLFTTKDDRIRAIATELQKEVIGYCNRLEQRVKDAHDALNHDKDLLSKRLSEIDAEWSRRNGWWKTFFQSAPSKKVKAMLIELDGFGDRLTALLTCNEQHEQLEQRLAMGASLTIAYSKVIAADPPIGDVLARIQNDLLKLRNDARDLGVL